VGGKLLQRYWPRSRHAATDQVRGLMAGVAAFEVDRGPGGAAGGLTYY
jgi:hypothetical protein